jgi:hypothetical protein
MIPYNPKKFVQGICKIAHNLTLNKHKNAFSFSSTFLGTMLELPTNTFTLLKNPYHKNSTIILCSALCNMGQNLELAGAIQEVQWFKMMV